MSQTGRFVVSRGVPDLTPTNARSYAGAWFPLRFTVTLPIQLKSIGFFGPCRDAETRKLELLPPEDIKNMTSPAIKSEPIIIRFFIKDSAYCTANRFLHPAVTYLAEQLTQVNLADVKDGQVFLVPLDTPVSVPANVPLEINFEIQGPTNPCIKFMRLPDKHPNFQTIYHQSSGVEFSFFGSSKQLPSLGFDLP